MITTPEDPKLQNILNLLNGGFPGKAMALCEEYCTTNESSEKAWFLRGTINNQLSLYDESERCYLKSISINPNNSATHYNLACVLLRKINISGSYNLGGAEQQDIRKKAITSFQKALALDSIIYQAHHQIGIIQTQMGHIVEGIQAMKLALRINPGSEEVRIDLSRAYGQIIPRWHYPMLNDTPRNKAYEQAVERAVGNDTIVLEIGTGAGLVSMIAARAGAKHVYTCEMIPAIAEKAREIIAANGYADKITVINKPSTDLRVGVDLPRKADVFVSELVDSGLLGDDAIEFVEHARANFLVPDSKVIPKAATVYAALIDSKDLSEMNYVHQVCGFDLSLINEFSTAHYVSYALENYPHRYLSDVFEVFSFDFSGAKIVPEEKFFEIPIVNDGQCHVIVFWFKLFLDDQICFDSGPPYSGHWLQNAQFIEYPVTMRKGQVASMKVTHNRRVIRFGELAVSDQSPSADAAQLSTS